jgi:hypothetical protein
MTDENGAAKKVGSEFALHGSVNHGGGEYVRGNIHTNTIEGYLSIMKRAIYETYHHVSQRHLKRYLTEFEFLYNERVRWTGAAGLLEPVAEVQTRPLLVWSITPRGILLPRLRWTSGQQGRVGQHVLRLRRRRGVVAFFLLIFITQLY